jgi:small-conductance mechanosensitive channel
MASARTEAIRRFLRNFFGTVALGILAYIGIWLFATTVLRIPPDRIHITNPTWDYLLAAWILFVGVLLDRTFTAAIRDLAAARDRRSRVTGIGLVMDLLVGVGALLAILFIFNVDPSSIFLGSAFTGVVLILATQTLLANIFAGIMIVASNPYYVGDRISLISASYGALGSTYPHEQGYPAYTGTVVDTGLIYTILKLDNGTIAKIPNGSVLGALVVNHSDASDRMQRIRVTLPHSVPLAAFERVVAEIDRDFPAPTRTLPPATAQVADLQPNTWDGVVVIWTKDTDEARVRDAVLRRLVAAFPQLRPAPPAPAPPPG